MQSVSGDGDVLACSCTILTCSADVALRLKSGQLVPQLAHSLLVPMWPIISSGSPIGVAKLQSS